MTLSIITINYNNRDGLQKTIDSVLAQTWKDYEWIVIDGGSTDGSRELIEQYQEHFAYWCSEPDKGVYHAMNKGIAKAKGDYVNFMNSGDAYYDNQVLKRVFVEENIEDVVYGDWMEMYKDKMEIMSISQEQLFSKLWFQNICHQAMFIKTRILKEKGYDEAMKFLADWVRNTEMVLSGKCFKRIPIIICKYDMYGISSQRDLTVLKEEIGTVRNLYPKPLLVALQELYNYRCNKYVQQTLYLTNGNRVSVSLTKCVLITLSFISRIFSKKRSL